MSSFGSNTLKMTLRTLSLRCRFYARDAFRQTLIDDERRIAANKRRLKEEEGRRSDVIWRTNLGESTDRQQRPDWTDSFDKHSDMFWAGFLAGALCMAWAFASLTNRPSAPKAKDAPRERVILFSGGDDDDEEGTRMKRR